jgi:hypothetical protein
LAKKDAAAAKATAEQFKKFAETTKNPVDMQGWHNLLGQIALYEKHYDDTPSRNLTRPVSAIQTFITSLDWHTPARAMRQRLRSVSTPRSNSTKTILTMPFIAYCPSRH